MLLPGRAGLSSAAVAAGRRPLVMAHRGASACAPENTLAAFQVAIDDGAEILETDVWWSSDGHLVCHHDRSAERMAGEPLDIPTSDLASIKRLRITGGRRGDPSAARIPTLDELLDLAPPGLILALELKDPRFLQSPYVSRLAERLKARLEDGTVFALSFHLGRLMALRRAAPDFAVGHITLRWPLPTQPAELLGPYWRLLTFNPFYVALAHASGRWVAPLDPDPHARLARYVRLGVDAVLTDDPGETRAKIAALRAGG